MGLMSRIRSAFTGKRPLSEVVNSHDYKQQFVRRVNAKYDAAQTSRATEDYWANADHLSPNASLNVNVRRKTRSRARYELENNSFARSMALGVAAHMIGTGPRRRMMTGNREADERIEKAWLKWSESVQLAGKLRTMRKCKVTDGSAFAQMMTNPRLRTRVQLDLQLIEDDQIATPTFDDKPDTYDGIKVDNFGNAISYTKLKTHPGTDRWHQMHSVTDSDTIAAQYMLHSYRVDRPGQVRGICEIASVLPLFAMLRRYQIAVLSAAETAANFAAVMTSDLPPGSYDNPLDKDDYGDAVPIEFGSMVTLPMGWKASQMKAEQPTSTFEMFNRAIKSEIARALLMPYNVAAADSSQHNFSSGRLDLLLYIRFLETERCDFEHQVLNPLFDAWLSEYLANASNIAPSDIDLDLYPGKWQWDAAEFELDPLKSAKAEQERLFTTRSLQHTMAKSGLDYDQTMQENADALGVSIAELKQLHREKYFGGSSAEPLAATPDAEELADEMIAAGVSL